MAGYRVTDIASHTRLGLTTQNFVNKMKIKTKRKSGFTLAETLVSMAVISMSVAATLSGIAFGINSVNSQRNELAATQAMMEKVETIRLVRWDDLGQVPASFNTGIFHGEVHIDPSLLDTDYGKDLKQVAVTLTWDNWGRRQSRTWYTYVAKIGLNEYIY